jgi:hypothetical protein
MRERPPQTPEIERLRRQLAKSRLRHIELLKELRSLKAHRDALIKAHESVTRQLAALEGRHTHASLN